MLKYHYCSLNKYCTLNYWISVLRSRWEQFENIIHEAKSNNTQGTTALWSLKVRSHQTRMTRMTQMIYMLSQCKDAKDNPAALFGEWGGGNGANFAFFSRENRKWRELKNLNFGRYSRRVNQSGACSSSDVITSGGRKSKTTIVVVCGYPELYIHLRTFTKTGIHFATRLELPAESQTHDANSRMLCSEFYARMKQISRPNEASKLKMFTRPTSHE